MTDETLNFIAGILSGGLFGFVMSFILKNWDTVQKTYAKMFVKPPVPVLLKIPPPFIGPGKAIGAAPNQSPIKVVINGCFTILFGIILILGLFALLFSSLGFAPLGNLPAGFLEGVLYSGIIGFFLQQIRAAIKRLSMAYKKIISPPEPALTDPEPPNNFRVGANPKKPPFAVLTENFGILLVQSVWLVILAPTAVGALIFVYNFLMDPDPLFVPDYTPPAYNRDFYDL